jgi:hypothetical protein
MRTMNSLKSAEMPGFEVWDLLRVDLIWVTSRLVSVIDNVFVESVIHSVTVHSLLSAERPDFEVSDLLRVDVQQLTLIPDSLARDLKTTVWLLWSLVEGP